jgi:hypothetical protein
MDEKEPLLTEFVLQAIMDGIWEEFIVPQVVDGVAPVAAENAFNEIEVQYRIMAGLPPATA